MEGGDLGVPRVVGELQQTREDLLEARGAFGIEACPLWLHGTWLYIKGP